MYTELSTSFKEVQSSKHEAPQTSKDLIYISILHLNRSDDVTGLYSCNTFDPTNNGKRTQKYFYLYGGSNSSIKFLNAGKTFYQSTNFYNRIIKLEDTIAIPCSTNYPTQDIFVDIIFENGVRSKTTFFRQKRYL